jgi:pyruvate kinase
MTTAAGATLVEVAHSLTKLRDDLLSAERAAQLGHSNLHETHRRSAVNLVHYLALRRRDVRKLQHELARLGLSSLGRCEAHVLASVDQVVRLLETLTSTLGGGQPSDAALGGVAEFDESRTRLLDNATAALGTPPTGRATRIMVTMPSEAAVDPRVARDLVERGMDCARINCAHDGPHAWAAMVDNVRKAAAAAGRPCRILMDLAGPKLRTGPLPAVAGVIKLRPTRDRHGRVIRPATAWLVSDDEPTRSGADFVPVPSEWLVQVRTGDTIGLSDTRRAHRTLHVAEVVDGGARVETSHTIYLDQGITLHVLRDGAEHVGTVGALLPIQLPLTVRPGDRLVLSADLEAAASTGQAVPPRVGCTLPEVFDHVRPGHRVWFDDGGIGAVTVAIRPGEADLDVTVASQSGTKLRAEKGINLPDTDLHLSAITADDAAVLPFVAGHADLVGMSFVQRPRDITALHEQLIDLGADHVGIVLKIETAKAFSRLPDLLLAAMAHERVVVMIARGDLAVECGWERLAEVQEEILWLAEAAHLPVIWATQVLDQLARTGQPSRAEITDAAMSQRAECVMLNKGPHIVEAVAVPDDILRRMGAHQHKKVPLLRRLRAWSTEPSTDPATGGSP